MQNHLAELKKKNFITSDKAVICSNQSIKEGMPTIIFIGGWRMSKEWWSKQEVLKEQFSVIFLDMRSYGDSQKTANGNYVAHHALDLLEIIKQVDSKEIFLVGWSLGASTILSFFESFQTEKIIGITLIDQSPKILSDNDWKYGLGKGEFSVSDMNNFINEVKNNDYSFVSSLIPDLFEGSFFEKLNKSEIAWMRETILQVPTNSAIDLLKDHILKDWRRVLSKIDVPVLLVAGRESKIFPFESSIYLNKKMINSELIIFENSGHAPFYEEPERFNKVLSSFIIKKSALIQENKNA